MIPPPPAQVRVLAPSPLPRLVRSVLVLARPDGAIPDSPGGTVVNADSNFLYLLTGLAHLAPRNPALWERVEQGLRWLGPRRWGAGDPLPGAFPDGLPLEGPGLPMGAPPTAAIGATSARFVALVGALPHPPPDLVRAAREVWAGLLAWNWVEGRGLRSAWLWSPGAGWSPREVWYAADQADYEAGRRGARRLGFSPCPSVPWQRFGPSRLALDGSGQPQPLPEPEEAAALAILAFDGPRAWRPRLLRRLQGLEPGSPGYLLPLAARAHLGDAAARKELLAHLGSHPLPLDRDRPGSPVYLSVAGFVMRAFPAEPMGVLP